MKLTCFTRYELETAESGVLGEDLDLHPIIAALSHESNSVECRKQTTDALDGLTTYLSQSTSNDGVLILNPTDQDAHSVSDSSEDMNLDYPDVYSRKFNASSTSLEEQDVGFKTYYEMKEEQERSQEQEKEDLEMERQDEFRQSTEQGDNEVSEQSRFKYVSEEDLRLLKDGKYRRQKKA